MFIVHSEHYDPSRSIILTGFMASGKTTVGKKLAELMRREFFDIDEIILKKAGKEIFDLLGKGIEQPFRNLESQVALELMKKPKAVIAYGGGTLFNPGVLGRVLSRSFLVYLSLEFETLWARIESSQNPLRVLTNRLGREGLRELFESRKLIYEKAHLTVLAENFEPEFTAKVINHAFYH